MAFNPIKKVVEIYKSIWIAEMRAASGPKAFQFEYLSLEVKLEEAV